MALAITILVLTKSKQDLEEGTSDSNMNYDDALNYIHGTLRFGIKLGLESINTLLDLMGNPQDKLRCVHVAGTNGKGSTVTFISNILIEAGYKVGIFTSPSIEHFNERIKVNSSQIEGEELARITAFVKEHVDSMILKRGIYPTEFEIVMAIAFQYFYEMQCDVVVLEVGLGGRFDATNVIKESLVSVITTISYDHMDRLGDTLEKIAFEKAGIIKEGADVVVFPQDREVMKVISGVCEDRKANMHVADFSTIKIKDFSIDGQEFIYGGWKSLYITLLGEHQIKNAVIALNVIELLSKKGYKITEESIKKGLLNAKWPGRLEVLSKHPIFLVDGAHNGEGALALSNVLKSYFPEKKVLFIVGALKDKDVKSIIEPTVPIASGYITVTPESPRALPSKEMSDFVSQYCKNVLENDTIEGAIKAALGLVPSDGIICAYGSLYYIGKIRSFFV